MLYRVIQGLLKEKAVILVTHQRQFLRLSGEVILISKVRKWLLFPIICELYIIKVNDHLKGTTR